MVWGQWRRGGSQPRSRTGAAEWVGWRWGALDHLQAIMWAGLADVLGGASSGGLSMDARLVVAEPELVVKCGPCGSLVARSMALIAVHLGRCAWSPLHGRPSLPFYKCSVFIVRLKFFSSVLGAVRL